MRLPTSLLYAPPGPVVRRIIHNLDASGRVVSIDDESPAQHESRRAVIVQTQHLMRAVNDFFWFFHHLPPRDTGEPERDRGYDIALADIRGSDPVEQLRHAMTDLRYYLGIASERGER